MTDIDYSNNIDNSVNYNTEYFLIKERTNKKEQMSQFCHGTPCVITEHKEGGYCRQNRETNPLFFPAARVEGVGGGWC